MGEKDGEAVFLDVNVPMYAAGKDHPYKAPCAWLMEEIAEGRLEAAVDTEIIQEMLYRYGALQLWDIGVTITTNLVEIVPIIYPVTPGDMRIAIELFRQYAPRGVTARDLLHVAVMQNNGLNTIVSTDKHFDQVEGVIRFDPQTLFPGD